MTGKDLTIKREKLGLSPEDLAKELEVPVSTIERWEMTEYKEIPISRLLELALETLERKLNKKTD